MGTIYPNIQGTKWWRLGWKSFDLDAWSKRCFRFMDIHKYVVNAGKKHITVYAKNIDDAKTKACEKRQWELRDITSVRLAQ